MVPFPFFLSVVVVVRNQSETLRATLEKMALSVAGLVSDYEIIVVDNASQDNSVALLQRLAGEHGLPNLQVFALTKEVDADTASWAGVESALGDFVAVIDPQTDDIHFLAGMLEKSVSGADVVFAENLQKPPQSVVYRLCFAVFNMLYMWFNGMKLANEAPQYRVLSKRVVNFIIQHSLPVIAYRHLPATAGFARENMSYSTPPSAMPRKRLADSIDRGMRLLVSTTFGPMRLVTTLSLFGAISNLVYSAYVIAIAFWKVDVAPGWVTLSLQQSGMFFLISLVLLVLGEYILHMARLSNEGPLYHIAQEFTSVVMTRKQKLNIDEAQTVVPIRMTLVS